LIIIGLGTGLLFFPSPDFSKSLLVGTFIDKTFFNELFFDSLLFFSFSSSVFVPIFLDIILNKKYLSKQI
jgi:hypothetical protein